MAFRPWMRLRLASIHVTGLPTVIPEHHSVLLAANHVSWWDGFILREVQRRIGSTHTLATVMREDQLRRYPLFRWMGAVGVSPTPGGIRGALRQLDSLRKRGPVFVSFFPQGRIWPSWKRPPGFQPGLRTFISHLRPVLVLPVALHLEPLAGPTPSALVAVGDGILVDADAPAPSVERVEGAVTAALSVIYSLLDQWGEDLPAHWPDPFQPLASLDEAQPIPLRPVS